FGSSKAHQQLREELIENNQLEGIISLPSGVFKPYAGVSTAILLFTKGGETDQVWFYDMQADGYSLDDKRAPKEQNDLPDVMAQYAGYRKQRASNKPDYSQWRDKTQKAFLVDKAEIAGHKYDLSINRYKEVVYEEEVYESPKVILKKLQKLEEEIVADLAELESML
ncbi:MAG: type I restriction enzyme M protein, partial [Gammaproteobacteria bacterium]